MIEKNKAKRIHSYRLRKRIQYHLLEYVRALAEDIGIRSLHQYSALKKAGEYIDQEIRRHGFEPKIQSYTCQKKQVQNIIFEKTGLENPEKILVIGAHYDTVEDSPGADDNATGVAAGLELIRLMKNFPNKHTIRFVFFTLEEPPYFGTEKMGSLYYAKQCYENGDDIFAMISLEMLGYFTEREGSQRYPMADMGRRYPGKGNFVAIVGNESSREFTVSLSKALRETALIPTESLIAFNHMPGIELSDHSSFWRYGYPAVMITDTAYFRNPNYHQYEDTPDQLDFKKFARLVLGLDLALRNLDQIGT